jgi:uncharacterized membrane protein YraQ (UPF0718 family)
MTGATTATTYTGARRSTWIAALVFLALAGVLLTWAKWDPYVQRALIVAGTHKLGTSILTGKQAAPPSPSLSAAWTYAVSYFAAIWPALVAGLVIASAVESFLPRRWLLRVMAARTAEGGALVGGLLAAPCMMCTCCAAPVAVSLRRSGVPVPAALAYWLGNPAINPAVLVFAAFVLPWQWVALRAVSGLLLVFIAAAIISRLASPAAPVDPVDLASVPPGPSSVTEAAAGFFRALGRLALTLLPEYLVIVLVLGGLRGVLFPVGHSITGLGVIGVVLFAVAGTLFAIPTAGEIPIVQGLLHAGLGAGPVAALLLTLPATSLPSMVMTGRAFPVRVLVATAVTVAALGVVCGLVAMAPGF